MAKSTVKIPGSKLALFKQAAKYENVTMKEANEVGDELFVLVSFRDPAYLMYWERRVNMLENQKAQPTKKK